MAGSRWVAMGGLPAFCFLWVARGGLRRSAGAARGRRGAPTIAVRSVRSGLPLRHPRPGLRPSLRIPSGASTRRAPPTPRRAGLRVSRSVASLDWRGHGRVCVGRHGRLRGQPVVTYAVSCGGGWALREIVVLLVWRVPSSVMTDRVHRYARLWGARALFWSVCRPAYSRLPVPRN